MPFPAPLLLAAQLAAQRWVHCQIYGILPDRQIRLYLVGSVRDVAIKARRKPAVLVSFTRGFLAVSDRDWVEWAPSHLPYKLPAAVEQLRVQPIGLHRLAIIAPGHETTTCILFGAEDDGRKEEIFPGFTLGPIDLDQVARTIAAAPNPDPEQPTDDTIA